MIPLSFAREAALAYFGDNWDAPVLLRSTGQINMLKCVANLAGNRPSTRPGTWIKGNEDEYERTKARKLELDRPTLPSQSGYANARDGFNEALKIYDDATDLLAEDQAAGKVQTYVTWTDYELDFGDLSMTKAEDLIMRGETELKALRHGPLKESGIRFFKDMRERIEKRKKGGEPPPVPPKPTASVNEVFPPRP